MPSTVLDSDIFKDMFGTAEMRAVFSDENQLKCYVKAEIALAIAQGRVGVIPREAADAIARLAPSVSIDREAETIEFVNAGTGYALSRELASGAGFAFVKTADGGATWSASVILPGENGKEGALRFSSPATGALRTIDGKLFYTADGATWTGASGKADGKPDIEFADKDIGWMIAYNTMTYTTNGGKSWTARQINFPASVNAFSLVQRDRGYAVGDHGMVYKYRIVPVEYTAKGMLPAPSM